METVEGQAENFFKEGKYDQAIEKYSQLIIAKPSWLAFNNRACCYMYLNKWQESEKDFTESIKLLKISQPFEEDQYYKSLYRRAQIYERLSKIDQAIDDLHKVISFGKKWNLRSEAQDMFSRLKSSSSREYDEALLVSEREEFLNIFRENMAIHPGSEWHVVSNAWFQNWQAYVNLTVRDGNEDLPFNFNIEGKVEHPGTINNKDIIDSDATNATISENPTSTNKICLKPELIENVNYVVLPREAFKFLEGIYRCANDIKRFAIEVNDSIYQVEIFLKRVKIGFPSLMTLDIGFINMSRKETIANLKKSYLNYRGSSINARVWKVNLGSISLERLQAITVLNSKVYIEGGMIVKEDLQLDDAEIGDEDIILIEPARNGIFLFSDDPAIAVDKCVFCQKSGSANISCSLCKKVKYCTAICKRKHAEEHKANCKQPKKLSIFRCLCRHSEKLENYDEDEVVVSAQRQIIRSKNTATGLQNLGNTCFMNSALQCLSHTEELTRYFLTNEYSREINKSNPLGTKGKLATAYAELLENLWKSGALSFAPWKFKKTLSSFAPQFVGYHQHDAHELLCYLLDGLHEDLNKVKKKPYFEDVDDKGKSDEMLSQESWDRHIARNQSIVVDLMHGQYKSTLFCPTCKNYSHTFDPFNSISLPIPQPQERKLLFYYIKSSPNEPPLRMGCDVSNDSSLSYVRHSVAKALKIPQNSFLFISIVNDVVREILDDDRKIDTLKSITLFAFQEEDCTIKLPVEMQITKERHKNKFIAFPRIVFIHKSNSFKNLHLEAFKKVKIYIEKYKEIAPKNTQASYEKFIQSPAYRLYFSVKKDSNCPLCKESSCPGCQVPYSTDLIESLHIKGRIIIELRWKEDCNDLGVNLQDINRCSEHPSASEERVTARPPISINECFHMFRIPEELEKENSWFCPTCRTHVQATKQMEIYKVPPILIIHLKRFKTHGYYREKLSTVVTFPDQGLDISGFVIGPEKPPLYDLYAVSNHFGNLGGGHYTATCFDVEQNKWLEFNDSKVTEATDIGTASSYLLFYKARP